MSSKNKRLQLEQIDEQLAKYKAIDVQTPVSGWINAIRTAIGMSARQLAKKMSISQQALAALEKREVEEAITLAKLREIGNQLDLKLIYSFVPKKSLEDMVSAQSKAIAKSIVLKTSEQMTLENQKIEKQKIVKAIEKRAKEIEAKMPNYLWD